MEYARVYLTSHRPRAAAAACIALHVTYLCIRVRTYTYTRTLLALLLECSTADNLMRLGATPLLPAQLVLTLVTLLSKLYLDRYGSTAQAAAEAGEGDAPLTLPGPHGSVHGGALAAVEGSHHARVSLAIGRLSSAIPRSPPCPHCGYAQHHNPSRHGPKAGDRSGSGKGPRSSAPRLLQQQQQHHPLSHTAGNAGPSPAGEVAVSSAGSPANGSHHGLVSGPGAGAGADGMHSRARPVGLYDVQVHHP